MQFSQPFHEPTTGTHAQPPPPRFFDHALEAAAVRRVEEEIEKQEAAPCEAEPETARGKEPAVEAERTHLFAQLDLHTESNFFVGFSGDLSDGGLFITSYQPLRVGEAVEVELCLAGQFVSVTGRVVWRRVPLHGRLDLAPGAGIVLEALSPTLRAQIARFMQRREPWFVDDEVLPLGESSSEGPPAKTEPTVVAEVVKAVEADHGREAGVAGSEAAVSEASRARAVPSGSSQGKARRPGRKQRRGRGRRNTKH